MLVELPLVLALQSAINDGRHLLLANSFLTHDAVFGGTNYAEDFVELFEVALEDVFGALKGLDYVLDEFLFQIIFGAFGFVLLEHYKLLITPNPL